MTHHEILEMESKGYIGDYTVEVPKCSICEYNIIFGYDEYITEEFGLYERFYHKECKEELNYEYIVQDRK